jgi:hypothetical protein
MLNITKNKSNNKFYRKEVFMGERNHLRIVPPKKEVEQELLTNGVVEVIDAKKIVENSISGTGVLEITLEGSLKDIPFE